MFRVLSCLGGEHDLRLVALAGMVCLLTSLVTINLFHRAQMSKHRVRVGWISAAAIAGGCGIWATHFIAMLAYQPGIPVAYDVPLTTLSLVAASAFTGVGLAVAANGTRPWNALLGGVVIGFAIASMHYLGMYALQVPGKLTWSLDLTASSIVLDVMLCMLAMRTATLGNDIKTMVCASLALTAAIVVLHFTAMGAVTLEPDPTQVVRPFSVPPSMLALAVAAASSVVLAVGFTGSVVDRRMSEKSEQLEVALHNMSQGLCMLNSDFEVAVVNSRFLEMFKIPQSKVVPRMPMAALMDLAEQSVPFGDESRAAIRRWAQDLARDKKSGRTFFQRTDGRIFAISHEQMPVKGGWVETFEDITERRQAEEKIAYLACHDGLTGLPNRTHFREQLEKATETISRTKSFAVLCLDLDHFKDVNDTLGHQGGDELLKIASERLSGALRETDLVARIGGDEFAILQLEQDQPAAATGLASRLVEVMSTPIPIGEYQMPIGVSVGIAIAPADGAEADQLLKNADLALYRAKAEGRGTYRFFEPGMDTLMQARRALEIDLRHALATSAFEVYYQPIVDVVSREISSFEALIRWNHPVRGMVSPADFIPLAEETGLIVPIGEWVLHEACTQAARWPEHVHIAVNLSPVQFKRADLVSVVVDALAQSGISPDRLELEITESVLLQDSDATLTALHKLRSLGVSISMDDFGTGYSSLSYLRKFPFDKIKIDQSFIRDLADGGDSLAIVRAVTGLSSSLGITTVAEGVETAEQFNRLRAEGCTKAQGYLFGAAKPADEAIRQLSKIRRLQAVA
jgi:diguanylate cyclase (GGDEF)-like protein